MAEKDKQNKFEAFQQLLKATTQLDGYYRDSALRLTFSYLPHLPELLRYQAFTEALVTIANLKEASSCAKALTALLPYLPANLLAQALAVASNIEEASCRVQVLTSLIPHLPSDLLVEALTIGSNIEEASCRAQVLRELAPHLLEPLRHHALKEALAATGNIEHAFSRADALKNLIPHIPSDLLAEALTVASNIDEASYRIQALRELVPHLPESLQHQALTKALAAIGSINWASSRAEALKHLIPHIPSDLLAEALTVASNIDEASYRIQALRELVPHLPESLQHQALTAAFAATGNISKAHERVQVLKELVPHLPDNLRHQALTEALAAASKIPKAHERVQVLKELVPHLPDNLRHQALTEALAAASKIPKAYDRVPILAALIPYMPKPLQNQALTQALAATGNVGRADYRAAVLTPLLPNLPEPLRYQALTEALSLASNTPKVDHRTQALRELAPHLPPDLLSAALTVAGKIDEASYCIHVVRDLLPYLPESLQREAFAEALTAIDCIQVLKNLVPHLPEPLQHEAFAKALTATGSIDRLGLRAKALTELIPHLPPDLLDQALIVVSNINDTYFRAETLTALASHLAEPLRYQALAQALKATINIDWKSGRIKALTALIPHLREPLLREALIDCLNVIREDEKDYNFRATALSPLIPYLPDDLLPEAFTIACGIQDSAATEERIRRLSEIDSKITEQFSDDPDNARRWRANENEEIDRKYCDAPRARARVLANLFFRLEGEQQTKVFEQLLETIEEIPAEPCKTRSLIWLAPYLPKSESTKAWNKALTLVRKLTDDVWTRALESQLPFLPTRLLQNGILLALHVAEEFLFAEHGWWYPNMIRFEEPVTRYLNAFFTQPDNQTVPPEKLLVYGQSYNLCVNISNERKGLGEDDVSFPEQALDQCWDVKDPLSLTVVAASKDFDIAHNVLTLKLSREGSSEEVKFNVRPRLAEGQGVIQLYVFYKGYELQSKQVKAYIVPSAEVNLPDLQQPAQTANITFTTIAHLHPRNLALLPERVLTVNVKRDLEDGSIELHFLDRTRGDAEIDHYDTHLPPDAVSQVTADVRNQLEVIASNRDVQDGQKIEVEAYEWLVEGNEALLNTWLPKLANVGHNLYSVLLPEQLKEQLQSALQPGIAIQVNINKDSLGLITIPWALMYQRDIMYVPDVPGFNRVCEHFKDHDFNCTNCPNAQDPCVVCPYAFWGYRYAIEQLPCWIDDKLQPFPSLVREINNDQPLRLNLNVWRDFDLWRDHLPKIESAGQVEIMLAEEILKLNEVWKQHSSNLDLVYFYCHGGTERGQPYLKLSNGSITGNFLRACKLNWSHKPLVFLNGCATGEYGPNSYVSLIDDFRKAGASGVVGTECPVPELFAEAYAVALLSRFFHGEPLGQAMRAVRLDFLLSKMNPLGLVYTLYAANEVALARSVAHNSTQESLQ